MSQYLITKQIVNGLLKMLAIGGMGACVVIAPGNARVFAPVLKRLNHLDVFREVRQVAYYMQRKGLATFTKLADGSLEMKLTGAGRARAQKVSFDELVVPLPPKWDGKWHLILFDIPEFQRKARSALTAKLKSMGFYQLQKSAWIRAYTCECEVILIRDEFGINPRSMVFSEVLATDSQTTLKRFFHLQ